MKTKEKKLSPQGDVQIQLGTTNDGRVVIIFGQNIKNLLFAPQKAREFAEQILTISRDVEERSRRSPAQ